VCRSAPPSCATRIIRELICGSIAPAAPAQFLDNVGRPARRGIEGHDADRIFILALEQIADDGFEIGVTLGLSPAGVPNRVLVEFEFQIDILGCIPRIAG
jgi:hypothetical protein